MWTSYINGIWALSGRNLTPCGRSRTPSGVVSGEPPRLASDLGRRARPGHFHRVAMMNAAAMPPMPIRMFQFPRSLMYGMLGPAT